VYEADDGGLDQVLDRVFVEQLCYHLQDAGASGLNLRIVRRLVGDVSMSDLAAELEISRSTLYAHLAELPEELHGFFGRPAPDTSRRRSDRRG